MIRVHCISKLRCSYSMYRKRGVATSTRNSRLESFLVACMKEDFLVACSKVIIVDKFMLRTGTW